ncbi:MAG: hypothetical protein HY906_08815 [Deltaproteobacteria bacterium]|nr:hypothetical protein [Deltaproteobacteria bacterium]
MQSHTAARITARCLPLGALALIGACGFGVRPAPAAPSRSAPPPVVAAALPPGDPPVEWDGRTQMVEDPEPARCGQGGVIKPLGPVGKNRDELRRRLTALVRQTVDYGIKIREDYRARPGDVPAIVEILLRGDPATVQYDHRFHPSVVVRYQIDFGANLIRVTQPGEKVTSRGVTVARRVFDIYFAPQSVSPLPATYNAYCDLKKPWDRGFKTIGREY